MQVRRKPSRLLIEGLRIMRVFMAIPSMMLFLSLGCRPSNDNLIIPGERVGQIVIGHTKSRDVGPGDGSVSPKYEEMGLNVGFDQRSVVSDIEVTKPTFHTQNGIAVGTDKAILLAQLGPPEIVDIPFTDGDRILGLRVRGALKYPGIMFTIGNGGKVATIIVEKDDSIRVIESRDPLPKTSK